MNNKNNNNKKIQLIDGICGSGKSFNVKRYIANNMQQRFIFALPTIALVKQTQKDLNDLNVSSIFIESSSGNVQNALTDAISPLGNYRVIVISHSALETLGKRVLADFTLQSYLKDFVVFVDEAPNPLVSVKAKIEAQKNNEWLRGVHQSERWFSLSDFNELKSYWNEPTNPSNTTRDLLWCLMANYPVIRNKETTSGYTLHGYAHSPIIEVFKHCQQLYVMSANVSNCPFVVVAREWCGINSELAPEALQPDLDRRTHKQQGRVKVHALLPRRASMTKLAQVWNNVLNKTAQILQSDFLYATNGDKAGAIKCNFKKEAVKYFSGAGTNVPFISSGINLFGGYAAHGMTDEELARRFNITDTEIYQKGFNKAAFLGTARLSRECVGHISDITAELGKNNAQTIIDSIEGFNSFESAVQMVMRTVLRDQNNNDPVTLVFIDEASAKYFIEHYYPDAKLESAGSIEVKNKSNNTMQDVRNLKLMGLKQKEVSEKLNVSIRTVKNYWN
ncbi:DEAD/DEAH box helicase family protein [Yersinia enterocolitica]|uniref:DEAD/DEAH box helicase family protein n=1 Tax=Yersinia enterocolitica TaxID=630 RepID=UPI001CA4F2C8|nr:DEAD/DEAH box helicase family protein [Yersinia enterocolitica]MBW5833791.1 DEAD/DEAH box helicase family protein [Yersinia enterocolitica]